jgi:hypothetical protein
MEPNKHLFAGFQCPSHRNKIDSNYPRTSLLVRSVYQIAEYFVGSTGLVFSEEDLTYYAGDELADSIMEDIRDYGTAIAIKNKNEPGETIKNKMKEKNITIEWLLENTDLDITTIQNILNNSVDVKFKLIYFMCELLDINPITIGLI